MLTRLLLLLIPLVASGTHRVVYPVKGGEPIGLAVRLAGAGDTIYVNAGIYKEHDIRIKKPLILIGIGQPVIDAERRSGIFEVNASGTLIRGFRLINTAIGSLEDYAAIRVNAADGIILEDNEVSNAFFGFHFSRARRGLVRGNTIIGNPATEHQTGNGIHLWKCDSFRIAGNRIEGHRDGIYFEFVTHSSVVENISRSNIRYGLHFMFSHEDLYRSNMFSGNGAGVAVMYSRNVTMEGNRFTRNQGPSAYGLLLKDITDSRVERNWFLQNTTGIYMEGSSRIDFRSNVFQGNGWALRLQASCDDNRFSGSNFSANTFDVSTNGSLVLNVFEANYWDKYQGYDLNKDLIGDVPFRPVSLFSMVVERMPFAVLLWRSFFIFMLDQAEKVLPVLTPENLMDSQPKMKPYDIG